MTRLYIRRIPWPSYMVSVLDDDSTETKASFIVHDQLLTRRLTIYQFRGDPRLPWREWAAEHFPHAPSVRWERMTENGLIWKPSLKLKPLTFLQSCVAALRAFYRT